MTRHTARGFTLVELLVVITIIVLLLALLAPAMDRAIYQAELAVCGANKGSIARGALSYASSYQRFYPNRVGVQPDTTWPPALLYNGSPTLRAFGVAGNGTGNLTVFDDRPILRTFIALNAALNDPLSGDVDLENADGDSTVWSPTNLWFGYGYLGFRGMRKIGDRLEYSYDGTPKYTWRFDVLASDRDLLAASGVQTSHPDDQELTVNVVMENEGTNWKQTMSTWGAGQWLGNSNARGKVDLNFASDNGSVLRLNHVGWWEEDTAFVPDIVQKTGPLGVWWNTLPIQR